MKTIFFLSVVVLLSCIQSAMATKFVAPQDQVVKSPNDQFLLHINAKSGLHEVREGTKVLWSFEKDVWHHNYYVSNDGKYVLWVAWAPVQEDEVKTEALIVYSSSGVALKKTYAELSTPRPYRKDEIGPVGDFWRIWRGDVSRKGEVISIEVEGREEIFRIDLSKMEADGAGQPANRPETK